MMIFYGYDSLIISTILYFFFSCHVYVDSYLFYICIPYKLSNYPNYSIYLIFLIIKVSVIIPINSNYDHNCYAAVTT